MSKGKRLAPGETYAGRSPHVVRINCSVEREAAVILRRLSPMAKGLGRLISRMAYEFEARLADRHRLWERGTRELLAAVIDTNAKGVHE
jgi:hypothetical protein